MLSECAVLYVVHCVDTEGPLYEDISAHFQQLKRVFGIDVEPTRENLIDLSLTLIHEMSYHLHHYHFLNNNHMNNNRNILK